MRNTMENEKKKQVVQMRLLKLTLYYTYSLCSGKQIIIIIYFLQEMLILLKSRNEFSFKQMYLFQNSLQFIFQLLTIFFLPKLIIFQFKPCISKFPQQFKKQKNIMCPLLIQVQAIQPIETPILRKMSSANSFNQTTFSQSEQQSKKLLAQLPKVNSWGVCNLELSHLNSQQLSKQLMRVSFPDLLTLTLTNDFIQSVEFLSRLKAPNLHSIQLSNNCIMDVSSLRKIQASQLKLLSLVKNNINEIEVISEVNSKVLHVIKIETSCFRHQIEDIRALTKLIEPKVDESFQIYLKGRKRIQERKIFQKVIQKNHNTICPKISISWME